MTSLQLWVVLHFYWFSSMVHIHVLGIPSVLATVDSHEGNTWTCGPRPLGHLAGFALYQQIYHNTEKVPNHRIQHRLMYNKENKAMEWISPFPKCVLMDIYRAVPVKLLCSRYGMCFLVSGSMYSLAKPKSMMWMMCSFLFPCRPMRKFSGLTSL